jgi:hypothetical protein
LAGAVEARLEEITAIPPSFAPIPTRSRSRRVREGRLGGIPEPLVVKQGWINPDYPLDRRIARRVSFVLEDPFRRALSLSSALAAIPFPAPRPVLCWKRLSGPLPTETGILYPKIEASGSLLRYLPDAPSGNPYDRRLRMPPGTLRAVGRFLSTLNAAGFLHLDPTPQNILLRPGAADPPAEPDFVLIDVEAYRRLPFPSRPAAPLNRYARALAIAPLLPCIASADLPLFAESFALPGESPSAWLPVFRWLHRHPKLRPLAKPSLFLRALAPFRP